MINIYPVFCNKKQYLDLLLLADEQESMIDRYLERGDMFVLAENNEVKALCVITEGEFYQFNLSSCIRQQNSLTAQFVSFSLANLANIFYPPDFYNN